MEQFTNLYSVSKTLRFELQPIGRTKENIERGGILQRDEQRAEDYQKVKEFIDDYHKQFIKDRLWNFKLPLESEGNHNSLEEYLTLYEKPRRSEAEETEFTEVKDNLRGIIAKRLTEKGSAFDRIDKKELIREDLIEFLESDADKDIVRQFADFTTYFTGFHENRRNMYSAEEKSTAIAYRLIHQNLPKFMDNMKSFARIAQSSVADYFADIYKGWKERLNVERLEDIFCLDYFSETLTQRHIEDYNYIIGKKILEDGTEIKGINEYVNLYNQQQKDKSQRLPLLVPLYKQILCDREKLSWLAEEFDSDEKMLSAISETYSHLHDLLTGDENESLRSLLGHLKDFDLSRINITNDLSLTDISQHLFGQYDVFTRGLKDELRLITPKKKKESEEDYEDRISKIFKTQKSFSISVLDRLPQPVMEDGKPRSIEDYFMSLGAVNTETMQKENLFAQIENAYEDVRSILQQTETDNRLSQDKPAVAKIKALLDAFKDLQHFIKPLLGSGEENEKDELFYGVFLMMWDELDAITPLYNKVRNWLTRKPYSTEKIKLNFDNKGNFLGGWVDSKTEKSDNGTQYGGYLLRRRNSIGEYDYFLGVSADTKLFRRTQSMRIIDYQYERLDYYQLKTQTIFGSSFQGNYEQEVRELLNAFNHYFEQKEGMSSFCPKEKETIVAYLNRLEMANKDISSQPLQDKECSKCYHRLKKSIMETLKTLTRVPEAIKLSQQEGLTLNALYERIFKLPSKSFSYFPISDNEINTAMNRDKKCLYLFKISNKDLSYAEKYTSGLRTSRGTDNLHTMLFKALMTGYNGVYDIGTGEVFFRKKSIQYDDSTWSKGHHYSELKEKFSYPIISKRRYACDKFLFHLSLIINYQAVGKSNINPIVQETIRRGGFTHVIGIDRGERHLLYLSLIDLQGNIVKQMTLNEIINEYKGQTYKTNYHDLLAKREGDRTKARRSWDTIENIKELKEGYLSQVIHIISKMMVEYNAIVVLEDLNMGFMRGRQKIERQVYEKFEKMLIDKLNCYIDKQTAPQSVGGVLHPLQLANKFESFRKLGKQSGCLFYIPAWNTSKIDPVTGFVNLLDTRYETREKAKLFFSHFQRITYNAEKSWFEFSFDYGDFTTKAEGTRTCWTLCSYGTRIRNFRNPLQNNQWDDEEIELTEEFKKLFGEKDIDLHGNLKEAINAQTDAQFFKDLMGLMKLLLQMRNSKTNSEVDYLLSPVADEQGHFFDSRNGIKSLPDNADANGAFNIARKGLWAIRKIQATQEGEKVSLAITNKEWLQFAQTKPYLNK